MSERKQHRFYFFHIIVVVFGVIDSLRHALALVAPIQKGFLLSMLLQSCFTFFCSFPVLTYCVSQSHHSLN
jgi:hypothetical protein